MKRPGGHAHAFTRQKEQTVCLTQTPQQLHASKTKVFCSQQRAEYICLMCDEIHLAIIHVSPAYYIRTHTHTHYQTMCILRSAGVRLNKVIFF